MKDDKQGGLNAVNIALQSLAKTMSAIRHIEDCKPCGLSFTELIESLNEQ